MAEFSSQAEICQRSTGGGGGGEREKDDGLVSMYEVRFPLNGEIKLSCQTSLESSPEALDGWGRAARLRF